MFKLTVIVIFLFLLLTAPFDVFAQTNSFVSVVNPVRGADFWDTPNQIPQTSIKGQAEILKKFNISATYLVRFDAIDDERITDLLGGLKDEKGLFLEVTPTWTKASGVDYHQSKNWHDAGSAFLSGYERQERIRLIDTAFEKFKKVFNYYPKSAGAWWIDGFSLQYMQQKYGVTGVLIVADQYTTDNYQIWGQYFSTPYYPSKNHLLHPAQSKDYKLPVVVMQWAARDPINGYGRGVEESTYSVQPNDYIDYHDLNTSYFAKLLDIYTKPNFNQFGHLVVGLENSYSWEKYKGEYENQIKTLVDKQSSGQLEAVTMQEFASWYTQTFPNLSPPQIIVADDPLGSFKKVVWFMNSYYRAGWFYNLDGSVFRDIRQYVEGEEELCFQKRCDEVNFATFATRVLDEVSFGQKKVVDEGKIADFSVRKSADTFVITYTNEAGRKRQIEFLPRDIKIDEKISSIDGIILEATKDQLDITKTQTKLKQGSFAWSIFGILTKTFLFTAFLISGCFIPGLLILNKILPKEPFLKRGVVALILGFSLVTLLFYLLNLLQIKQAIFIYFLINLIFMVKMRRQIFEAISFNFKDKFNFLVAGLIAAGSIFQSIPTFKSGLNFPYGLGFWGPNSHDGVWHISLINQLAESVPPKNPIFGGELLKNYHYFYDLLVALTNYVVGIPVSDLVFRFYPVTFSIILGIGTFCIVKYFFKIKEKLAAVFSIYLVYFAGSFGWIVEYFRSKQLGGESAFWANQSISFNLNPPFAISLLFVIAILLLLPNLKSKLSAVLVSILAGSLIVFKAYGAILIMISFILVGILKRNPAFILTFFLSILLSALLFLPNFSVGSKLLIFSPFWFIHSMIDAPDRVGWVRLSLARTAGLEQGHWFKFFAAEAIGLALFIAGNLGTRVFALLSLLKTKAIFKDTNLLFIFIFSLLSLFIPILFIQAGTPWNTIQFIYYFLYISALLGGIVFARLVVKLPKAVAIVSAAAFILLTPINSWTTFSGYLGENPHAFISKAEIEALEFLRSQGDGIVLTYPYDAKLKNKLGEPWPILAYDSTAYVSAISGKQVFLEDEPQNQILLTGYIETGGLKERVVASRYFFYKPEAKFLSDNNIKYIYLPKVFNIKLEEPFIGHIFENEEVTLYKVKEY